MNFNEINPNLHSIFHANKYQFFATYDRHSINKIENEQRGKNNFPFIVMKVFLSLTMCFNDKIKMYVLRKYAASIEGRKNFGVMRRTDIIKRTLGKQKFQIPHRRNL